MINIFKNITYGNNHTVKVRDMDSINTKEDAYFIGYLTGDGNILGIKNNNRTTRMAVSSSDEYIIKYFNERYQPNSKYSSRMGGNNPNKNIFATKMAHRISFSPHYSQLFKECGILDYKKHRICRNISEKYMKHYLLGLMDSDGSINCHYGSDGNGGTRLRCGVKYTHPSTVLLNQIKDYIKNGMNVDCSINKKKNEECHCLSISGLNDCYLFLHWLYSDLPEIYNTRKYDRQLELIGEVLKNKLNVKNKVSGIRIYEQRTNKYHPFIVIKGKYRSLGAYESYDEAVKLRIINEAINIDNISKNSLSKYDPVTKTFKINYLSHDDNLNTFIEVDLSGNILKFEKESNDETRNS